MELYRHFNKEGILLYVGATSNILNRMSQHKVRTPWFSEIANTSIEYFQTKEELLLAEKQAIRLEQPVYNIRHNKKDSIIENSEILQLFTSLSLTETRVLQLFLRNLKGLEVGDTEYYISTKEYAEIYAIAWHTAYQEMKYVVDSLSSKLQSYLVSIEYVESGIKMLWNPDFQSLCNNRKNCYEYSFTNILVLKSNIAICLYKFLRSRKIRKYRIDIEEFRQILGLQDRYTAYNNLRSKVLLPAIANINCYTDLFVEMESIAKGRKVIALEFTICVGEL